MSYHKHISFLTCVVESANVLIEKGNWEVIKVAIMSGVEASSFCGVHEKMNRLRED